MISNFQQWSRIRSLREDDELSNLGPMVGGHSGHGDNEFTSSPGDAVQAFKDLVPELTSAFSGPSGNQALSEVVNAVLSGGAPEAVKAKLRQKVGSKWSHVVDLNDSPNPGRGPGLGNIPGSSVSDQGPGSHVIAPATPDRQ